MNNVNIACYLRVATKEQLDDKRKYTAKTYVNCKKDNKKTRNES